jgi:hypothetical protein
MTNDELLGYVRQQLTLKVSKEAITANLKSAGWNDADVNEAFAIVTPPLSVPMHPPVSPAVSVATPNIIQPQTNLQNTITPATAQEQSVNPSLPAEKSKSKKIFAAVLILVLIGLAGGAAYAYYSGFFVSLPMLASQAIDSARAAKTGTYDVTVNADFSGLKNSGSLLSLIPGAAGSLSFTSKSSYDSRDPANFKDVAVISASLGSLSASGEIRILDNTFYGVLTKAPSLSFLPTSSSYENKWFSFAYKNSSGQTVESPLQAVSPVNTDIFNKLTEDQKTHIYDLSRNARLIKSVKKLSPEVVGGEMSYNFLFDLDREGINSYLASLKEYINTIGKDDSALSAFDPTSFTKELDQIKDFSGEIWIGRNDKLPHKVMMNFGIQPDPAKDEQIKISLVGIFSGWNQPVLIVAPVSSVPFETLMSNAMNDSQQQRKDDEIKANLSNIRPVAEIFYNNHKNSYSGFCLSPDVKAAQKAVQAAGGAGFVCRTTAQKYALGVKMPQGGYWCADSLGASTATATLPKDAFCSLVIPK